VLPAGAYSGMPKQSGANQSPNRGVVAARALRRLTERQPGITINVCGDWRLEHAPILGRINAGRLSLLFDLGIPTFRICFKSERGEELFGVADATGNRRVLAFFG
jgi:hypothetical protein